MATYVGAFKLVDTLKEALFIRVSASNRWLVWDIDEWVVYERKGRSVNSVIVTRKESLSDALDILVEDQNDHET